MKPTNHHPYGKVALSFFALTVVLFFLSTDTISAQQQTSNFSIPRWVSGSTPVFTGNNTNVQTLNYGDSLNTIVSFNGFPDDGLGVDYDNMASMGFAYNYTVYLTRAGDSFSTVTSIPVGTHSINAYQSCSSGIVPPWTIGYDNQLIADTDQVNMNIADAIGNCIPEGDYQVDIAIDTYSVNSVGPSPQAINLVWGANAYNSNNLTQLNAPSSANTDAVALNPVMNYVLTQIAFVHVAQNTLCPTPTLKMPASMQSTLSANTATVVASYAGICPQNPCSYLWSDGETTATASQLGHGKYTVTVTTTCGATATASIMIYEEQVAHASIDPAVYLTKAENIHTAKMQSERATSSNKTDKKLSDETSGENSHGISLNLYPNPAIHTINFDLSNMSNTTYSIRIYDMLGNEVMAPATNVSAESGNQKIQINVDELQAGVYLYEVATNKTLRGKFIKQ
jgi:hypothetical protein